MKPPIVVRINGKDIHVQPLKNMYRDMGDYGHFLESTLLVEYDPDVAPGQVVDTVTHELLHAIEHQANCKLGEAKVRTIGTALAGMLMDNPELVKFYAHYANPKRKG